MIYLVYGMLWILGSDRLVAWWLHETSDGWIWSAAKGLLFIFATTALLFVLVKHLTQRYEAVEAALRESQQRWQFAIEGSGDGLWDWDATHNRVFYSKQWKAMLGYAEDEIGDSFMEWESRVHPDDLAQAKADVESHLRGETPMYMSEHRLRAKDGTYRWILDRGQVVSRGPDGKPQRVIGTHTDITTRKSVERRMADSLVFTQTVLRSSPLGLVVYKAEGPAVLANESAERIVGANKATLLTQNFRQLESWRRFGLLAAAERALATGQPQAVTGSLVTTFGKSLWMDVRLVPFDYSDEKHLLIVMADETQKRETFSRLQLMHAAINAAPLGWVVTNAAGTIEWVNPAFTQMTGFTAEEVVGRNPRVLKSGQHDSEFYAGMWNTIKRGEVWTGEMFNARKDGRLYQEHMTIAPIRDESGEIRHFVALKQDITERKNLEKQLARAQRLESIGMLASGIAHDLNNIFTPILLSLELLKIKYPSEDARKTLEMIEGSGKRGAGIVRQMLTFARGIDGQRVTVQAKYLVKEAADILTETLPRNIRVIVRVGAGLPTLSADATQLHQVLLNLAINARDAMPEGGELTIGAKFELVDEARAARQPHFKAGPCVALTVKDTGPGIPPEVLEHMFEPFFTTKPLGKGTGLGLSTVYGIVRSHGGAIEVATKLGAGTTFTILLRADGAATESSDSRSPLAETFTGGGRRVLVVDDEETIRLITSSVLQRLGFVVEVAADGLEGLEIFRRDPTRFAVVITDLMMPRMNGRRFAQEVRRLAPEMPIFLSSGLLEEATLRGLGELDLSEIGVHTVLRKPYTEAELLGALRKEFAPMSV